MKCSTCGKKGHNARTCKGAPPKPSKPREPRKPADLGSLLSAEHDVAEAARSFVRLSRSRDESMWDALSTLGTTVDLLEELTP